MARSPANLEEALRSLGEEAARTLRVHPGYEDLAAYCDATLTPTLTEAIAEHLAFCDDCTDVVLELRSASNAGDPSEASGRQLVAGTGNGTPSTPPTGSTLKIGLLIAAGITGLALLGTWWALRPSAHAPQAVSELAQSDRPTYRDSLGAVRSDPEPVTLTRGDSPSLWGLLPATEPSEARYRVQIENDAGRTAWKSTIEPVPGNPSYFYLRLDPTFFEPGRYRIEIRNRGRGRSEALGIWFLEARAEGAAREPSFE